MYIVRDRLVGVILIIGISTCVRYITWSHNQTWLGAALPPYRENAPAAYKNPFIAGGAEVMAKIMPRLT